MSESLEARANRLVALAKTRKRPLILTHDNPDPDSVAAALALAQIFEEKAGLKAAIAYGGIIGRTENRALLKVLKLPIVPISRIDFDEFDLFCLVDTQPQMGNHSLPPDHPANVILDHHPERTGSRDAEIAEVGGDYGATSTIAALYLRTLGIVPTREVATALFYGIKADTRDLGRETEDVDVQAYLWLFPQADKEALALIEHPKLPAEYFRLYHTAIEKGRVHGNAVMADLGDIYSPDMVAEVAERHLFLEGIKWSLAYAIYEDNLFLSLRTNDKRMNAGRLIREVVEELGGSAGGHGQMAGARIPVQKLGKAQREEFKSGLVRRFCEEWGVAGKPGIPLLAYDPRAD
ncbi:DHH family phosphoesterase [Vulgatibacter incomptus]|uniref:DHH family phosphoesterase n=1 Tax=Vulgatibacter incomptus TaxID=1391653 RepID=UPI001F0AC5BC|nr:DHHA1 domain-containing protein [Vulgatibacter incomptus]